MTEIELLSEILIQIRSINVFIQLLFYGIILLLIIYYGYWFFSRFFY